MKKFCPMTFLATIIITAVVAGGGVYYWQNSQKPQELVVAPTQEKCPTVEPAVTETPKCDFTLSMDQKPAGESTVTLRETYNEGAGFALTFPASWGFVNVTKHNLTDTSGETPLDELPQRASYTFTSEFRPYTHYFTIIISQAKYKDDDLVTQGNRVYITEDSTYYYNYSTSIQDCLAQDKCKEDEVEGIKSEIAKIVSSFELLNESK